MNTENNGGKTSYYDLPLPDRGKLKTLLIAFHNGQGLHKEIEETIDDILNLCPQTLNDLIEHKQMQPWQHEVFKACYAMEARAKRGKSFSKEREVNKIIYYAERGLSLIKKEIVK